jgi:Uma2 family endonuclease
MTIPSAERRTARLKSAASPAPDWTIDRLRKHFGMIPAERIVRNPLPGTAHEKDLVRMNEQGRRLCELVEGVLVEKAMGTRESLLAGWLLHRIWDFLEIFDLGIALPPDGMLRLMPGLVRVPDVSFISYARLPGGKLPDQPIAPVSPDLAVEVISEGNTKQEIVRKVGEYFQSGVRLVWIIRPRRKVVEIYTSPTQIKRLGGADSLDGAEVLPGFKLSLTSLFAPNRKK